MLLASAYQIVLGVRKSDGALLVVADGFSSNLPLFG
jgi:hypothetical protein